MLKKSFIISILGASLLGSTNLTLAMEQENFENSYNPSARHVNVEDLINKNDCYEVDLYNNVKKGIAQSINDLTFFSQETGAEGRKEEMLFNSNALLGKLLEEKVIEKNPNYRGSGYYGLYRLVKSEKK